MVKIGMVGGKFGNKSKNTSVHGTGKFLRGRVVKRSRRIRELATRDLLGQVHCWTSPLSHKLWGGSERITVGMFCRNKFNFC